MGFLKSILTIFISLFFSFFLIELFLYYDNYRPDYTKYTKNINNFSYTMNDNLELISKTSPNFLVLGDSFTHAEVCASKKEDFTNLIKKDYQNYSVYNLGVNGGSPIHYINILENIDLHEVNKILLVLYYNDINLTVRNCKLYKIYQNKLYFFPNKCEKILNSQTDSQNDTFIKKIDNFFETKLLSWTLIKEALANSPYINKFYNRSNWKNNFTDNKSDEFLSIINDLRYIQDFSYKNNINLKITYFPDVHYLDEEYARAKIWEQFIYDAKKFEINISNPWKYFIKNSSKKNLSWSLVDKHANCEANKIMSDYLLTILD